MDFSNSTRGEDGLYTVTVRDLTNRQDVVMPSKYIRFRSRQELSIGTKPNRALVNQTYNEKKDTKKFLQLFAQTLRSENDFMTATFGAVYEKGEGGKKVIAVYVPVENIKSDTDAKFILANLNAMAMSEGEIMKRADRAYKGKPFELRMDNEELQVIIDTAYDPEFVVDFEMPDNSQKEDIVVDSRIIVDRNIQKSESKRPAFLNKGFKGANNEKKHEGSSVVEVMKIIGAVMLVLLVLYFLMKVFSK